VANLATLINDGLIPGDIETTGPASIACFDTLFGEDQGLDEALKYLLFGPNGCFSAILACVQDELTPKFGPGTFIPLCFHQKTTIRWIWDNNNCIIPKNMWPAAFSNPDEPGTITFATGAGTEGPEDCSYSPDLTATIQAQLDAMFTNKAAQLTGMNPYGTPVQFFFDPPPKFRIWVIETCDLTETYGSITIEAPDGLTYVIDPKIEVVQDCFVEGVVCNEDGTTTEQWQNYAGEVVEAPDLTDFQASKCPLPTQELPVPIGEDPGPLDPVIELDKEALGDIIQAEDDTPPAPTPVLVKRLLKKG